MLDLIIQNGTVYDGSGADGKAADVGILDGRIVAVGHSLGQAHRVIDATGLAVTPGFVDSHSHSDSAILSHPDQKEKVEQGITTSIGGQCGSSPCPAIRDGRLVKMSEFLSRASDVPQGANIAVLAGHRAIRKAVMGMENRLPTAEELEQMKALVRDAMEAGAFGISYGMIYSPGCFADINEMISLASVVAEYGGIAAAHIRNESDGVLEAVDEWITVVRESGVRGVLSHHKSSGFRNHGKVKETVSKMNRAIADGCDLYCDVYPYVASSTSLSSTFIPKEFRDGHLSEHLQNPLLREKWKQRGIAKWKNDLSWVQINACTAFPEFNGLRVSQAAELYGKDVWDTLFDILQRQPSCSACYFTMCETDVEHVMSWERAMIGTDSSVVKNTPYYHPRLRGTFPRVLGRYVRERSVVPLPEMIRKMTSLPAFVYGLSGKGYVREGYDADLCIFDPDTIIDQASFTDPSQRAKGLNWVIVAGKIAAENAVYTGERNGMVLLRKAEK